MKKIIIFLFALFLSACVKGFDIPQIPKPQPEETLSDYLNNHLVNRGFVYNSMMRFTKYPFKSIYVTKNNEVLYQHNDLYYDFQVLDFYHHCYRYCEYIGGKSIIKRGLLFYLNNYDKPLFTTDLEQVMQFIDLRDNLEITKVPSGYYECKAGAKSFEVTNMTKTYAYDFHGYRTGIDRASGFYLVKFQSPQKIKPLENNENKTIEELFNMKYNKSEKLFSDPYFFNRQLVLFNHCNAKNGTAYIIDEATEYTKMLLGEYFAKNISLKNGSPLSDYTIICDAKNEPFTFVKTFTKEIRQAKERDINSGYDIGQKGALYELYQGVKDINNDTPLENQSYILKLVNNAANPKKAKFSSLFNDYKAYFYPTNQKNSGYIGILQNNFDGITKQVLTFKLNDGRTSFIGKVNEAENQKAKKILENNASEIIKKCSLNLKDFNINGYLINCHNDNIFIMKNNKIHYIQATKNK